MKFRLVVAVSNVGERERDDRQHAQELQKKEREGG